MPNIGNVSNPVSLDPLTASITSKFDKGGYNFLGAYRNKLINGNFDFWQRSISSTVSGYIDDRWYNANTGSGKTASRQAFTLGQTAVPGNPSFFARTVVTSVAGSANFVRKLQPIEGVETLSGRTVTVTFYAKADTNRNIAVELYQYMGSGGTPSADTSGIGSTIFNLSSSWQQFTLVTAIPSLSGKTIGTNNDDCLDLIFWFDAGTSFNTRAANLGQQSGTFDIAHVSLVDGDASGEIDPYEYRHTQQELLLCQRYYENSGVTIGATFFSGNVVNNGNYWYQTLFSAFKRVNPTMTITHLASDGIGFTSGSTPVTNAISNIGFSEQRTAAGTANAAFFRSTWTADAEL